MPKVWNLGNTTVRNPNRISDGLLVFKQEFQGRIAGKQQEALFAMRLREREIIETKIEGTRVNEANIEHLSWFGRKWRSAFVKLGFVTERDFRLSPEKKIGATEFASLLPDLNLKGVEYEITPAGISLLKAENIAQINDVFLRQLLQHELPSPLERRFAAGRMKPFVFLLQTLAALRAEDAPGLSKFEIGAFLQLFRDHTDAALGAVLHDVRDYRNALKRITSKANRNKLERRILEKKATEAGIGADSLIDYADTTSRYARMAGLIAADGKRLVLRESKIDLVEQILEAEPSFLCSSDSIAYLRNFYLGAELPTDNIDIAKREAAKLMDSIKELGQYPVVGEKEITRMSEAREVQGAIFGLQDQVYHLEEERFAHAQTEQRSIQDILEYLGSFKSKVRMRQLGVYDPPAYFEWSVWRGFLAIDSLAVPIHKTRNFEIDQDYLPIHHASAYKPDCIFEFDEFILVVEVTLLCSARQEAAEGVPVRQHVYDACEGSDKAVYALFVAPVIDDNTANTFRHGGWYSSGKEEWVDIVPITLDQYTSIIELLLTHRYAPGDIRKLLDDCLDGRRELSAPEWKKKIADSIKEWTETLAANL